jgi:hypothetical protein
VKDGLLPLKQTVRHLLEPRKGHLKRRHGPAAVFKTVAFVRSATLPAGSVAVGLYVGKGSATERANEPMGSYAADLRLAQDLSHAA